MKYLFFTDLHANVKAFNELQASGLPKRAPEIISTFAWLKSLKVKYGIEKATFGGDVFDSVQDLKMPYFNIVHNGVYNLDLPIDIIDGNHDKYDDIYKVLEPFRPFARIHSVAESYYDPAIEKRLAFFPFVRDAHEAMEIIQNNTKQEDPTLIFIHQGIQGYLNFDKSAIDRTVFDKQHIEKVFGGHYHFKFSVDLSGKKDKIIFPGSIITLHFDDSFTAKHALIYDTVSGETIWEENPFSSYFISVTQKQALEMMDQLDELSSVSYIRIVKAKEEQLEVPMTFLMKFKGYDIRDSKEKEIQYKIGDDKEDFDNKAYEEALTQEENHSSVLDLEYDQYKKLIMEESVNEAKAKLIKDIPSDIMEDVLKTTFMAGKR